MISGFNEVAQSVNIQVFAGAQLHMTHALPSTFEQAGGIREHRAIVEADTRMSLERVDIPERRVTQACDGTTIVQEFSNIGAAAAHALKPHPRYEPERVGEV